MRTKLLPLWSMAPLRSISRNGCVEKQLNFWMNMAMLMTKVWRNIQWILKKKNRHWLGRNFVCWKLRRLLQCNFVSQQTKLFKLSKFIFGSISHAHLEFLLKMCDINFISLFNDRPTLNLRLIHTCSLIYPVLSVNLPNQPTGVWWDKETNDEKKSLDGWLSSVDSLKLDHLISDKNRSSSQNWMSSSHSILIFIETEPSVFVEWVGRAIQIGKKQEICWRK